MLYLTSKFKNIIIICPSNFTANKVKNYLSSKTSIKVAYNGYTDLVEKEDKNLKLDSYQNKYLVIGNIKPHKNLKLVILIKSLEQQLIF